LPRENGRASSPYGYGNASRWLHGWILPVSLRCDRMAWQGGRRSGHGRRLCEYEREAAVRPPGSISSASRLVDAERRVDACLGRPPLRVAGGKMRVKRLNGRPLRLGTVVIGGPGNLHALGIHGMNLEAVPLIPGRSRLSDRSIGLTGGGARATVVPKFPRCGRSLFQKKPISASERRNRLGPTKGPRRAPREVEATSSAAACG
jgi:hypothetical protein